MTTPEKKQHEWLDRDGVAEWFAGKAPEDLDIIEHEGRFAILETIHRRKPNSTAIESTLVRVWIPNHLDKAKARVECLGWVQELCRLPERPSWTEACEQLGEAYVDQLDTVCLLARCVRDHDAPEHQHLLYKDLDARYGRSALMDLWERLNHHDFQADPRQHELTEDGFWAAVQAIDRVRNPSPLAAIDGAARDSLVTSMAVRLWSSRQSSSS